MRQVLVIDDSAAVRKTVERILVSYGFAVTTASDGKQGLARCKERRPDLVITDILMPEMEGIETISRLRALYGDLPILAMSGGWSSSKVDLLEIAAHLGATETLAKPFDSEELLRAIAKCAACRRQ